jgi:hypothetical protein
MYALIVNSGECSVQRNLAVTASGRSGRLRDLESGEFFDLGVGIPFRPGDGRLFLLE